MLFPPFPLSVAPNLRNTAHASAKSIPTHPSTLQKHVSQKRIKMGLLTKIMLLFSTFYLTQANLEGPFLFFGPKTLEKYRRPALKYLEQDDLMKIYEEQAAIVVFNNQDSVPLSSGYFPRLRKMVEGQPTLVLPQDFLDVHPDYISNETQVCAAGFYILILFDDIGRFVSSATYIN